MTPSPSDARAARDDLLVAGFTALAVVVHVLESAVPMPLPGIKPGLANLVVLVVLLRHGLRLAVWVALLREVVAALDDVARRFGLAGAAAVTEDGVVHATAALRPRLAPLVDGLRIVAP